ncbi:hypothetical protein FRC02_009222, partial [Tulasnella sp. 418]
LVQRYRVNTESTAAPVLPTVALDLGCGTGQVTRVLPKLGFTKVIGADPSHKMVDQARAELSKDGIDSEKIQFSVIRAEEVDSVLAPESVGLITAGVAAHWFDQAKIWPVLSKVLAPGGTVAFWGYGEFRIKDHPEVTPIIKHYRNDPEQLGPFWEQPGRDIVHNHMRAFPFPRSSDWDQASCRRIYFCGDHVPELDLPRYPFQEGELDINNITLNHPDQKEYKTDVILRKRHTWDSLKAYAKTWTALQFYYEKHPEERTKDGRGKEGDIVDRFIGSLEESIGGTEITLEWPLTLLLIKRKMATQANTEAE